MSIQVLEKTKNSETESASGWIAHAVRRHRQRGWQRFIEKNRNRTDVIHINDCSDDAARLRLEGRSGDILGQNKAFSGAKNTLHAAGLLIDGFDALDAAPDGKRKKHQNVFLVNVAPRDGEGKKHENGTPFCYFRYKDALVVATADGLTLSLVKKLALTESVQVLDTRETLAALNREGIISDAEEKRINETQFRSYEFSPRVALYLERRKTATSWQKNLADVADAGPVAWHVDAFAEKYGNVKTTLFPEDVFPSDVVEKLKDGVSAHGRITVLKTAFGELPVYRRLKDVPDGEAAVIVGSSGLGEKRFLEIVIQGGNAGKTLGINVGDAIL